MFLCKHFNSVFKAKLSYFDYLSYGILHQFYFLEIFLGYFCAS